MSDEALFTVLDDARVQATELGRGPWDPRALHGGPVAALAARGLERAIAAAGRRGDPAFRPVRLTVELERPVGLDPLVVAVEVTRPGRSVRTAELHPPRRGRPPAGAGHPRRHPGPTRAARPLPGGARPSDPPPPPPPDGRRRAQLGHLRGHGLPQPRRDHTPSSPASFVDLGPATDWIRLAVPVVAGEEPSPLQRVAAAADFGNGVSAAVDAAGHTFINPDLTVTLVREAVGVAIGIAATTRVDAAGVGTTETTLWDERGRLGAAVQTLLVEPR